jgi:hypothetical protein
MEDNVQDIQHDKIVLGNLFEVLSHIHALNADELIQVL